MKIGFKILILALIVICVSCKNDKVFDESPSQRNANHIAELKKELVNAPHGWSVTYFSRTDSLLFTNANELINLPRGVFEEWFRFGYGGHSFLMKFSDEGMVEMLADYNEQSLNTKQESEFAINQNTFTQLSFTTYNYIHELVNDQFRASSDFLYLGKDIDGNLVFKTSSYTEPAREYIVFKKLDDENSWLEHLNTAYENRAFFEKMKNPQIKITRAGRTFFSSSSEMKMRAHLGTRRRYHLFLSIAYFAPQGLNHKAVYGLGSGYVGTAEGLTFRPGIRYSKDYTFYDFIREGNSFVCELVKVFDPYTKTERWTSKHLAPNGEPTGVKAEIIDEI